MIQFGFTYNMQGSNTDSRKTMSNSCVSLSLSFVVTAVGRDGGHDDC